MEAQQTMFGVLLNPPKPMGYCPTIAEGQAAYEYFHGDNDAGIGASHQTGCTGLVATLLQQSGE